MTAKQTGSAGQHTVSQVFGEITWLLSQSAPHRSLTIADLEWLVMPPILNRQFYIFRKGERPVGAALWALLDVDRENNLEKRLKHEKLTLAPGDWKTGGNLWLIALIAPFADPENGEAEVMLADLIAGPFAGKSFRMIYTDPTTHERSTLTVGENAKVELVGRLRQKVLEAGEQTK